jgi:hypothetical protein
LVALLQRWYDKVTVPVVVLLQHPTCHIGPTIECPQTALPTPHSPLLRGAVSQVKMLVLCELLIVPRCRTCNTHRHIVSHTLPRTLTLAQCLTNRNGSHLHPSCTRGAVALSTPGYRAKLHVPVSESCNVHSTVKISRFPTLRKVHTHCSTYSFLATPAPRNFSSGGALLHYFRTSWY